MRTHTLYGLLARPASRWRQLLRTRCPPCGVSRGVATERDALLKGVQPEHREAATRAVDMARAASDAWTVAMTDFLEPPVAADCRLAVGRLADAASRDWGGHPFAERVRLRLGRPEVLDGEPPSGVALLHVAGSFIFDEATHRDFLGAVLGAGIERDRVGDIIVQGDTGAQVLVTPEMATFLAGALTSVRSVAVRAVVRPIEELQVVPPKADTIRSTEASLRLDAIASAGFRMSRAKMADMIEGGDVRVNWKAGVKTSALVKSGDVISVRGKGRVTVGEISVTKKERWSVELHRLL